MHTVHCLFFEGAGGLLRCCGTVIAGSPSYGSAGYPNDPTPTQNLVVMRCGPSLRADVDRAASRCGPSPAADVGGRYNSKDPVELFHHYNSCWHLKAPHMRMRTSIDGSHERAHV